MEFNLRQMIAEVEENATLQCGSETFTNNIISLLNAFDDEIVECENELYTYEDDTDEYDDDDEYNDDDGFSDINVIANKIMQSDNDEAKALVSNMLWTKTIMCDVIYCAKLVLDEGAKTLGSFGANDDDCRQKFINVAELIRSAKIAPLAHYQILMILAGKSSIMEIIKGCDRMHDFDAWYGDATKILDTKLNKICNADYSPALNEAKIVADERILEHCKANLYKNMKSNSNENDDICR